MNKLEEIFGATSYRVAQGIVARKCVGMNGFDTVVAIVDFLDNYSLPGGSTLYAWATNLTRDSWSVLVAVDQATDGTEIYNTKVGWLQGEQNG